MIKVMTIVGTRPEIIKMSRVIHAFDRYTDHVLVHTGQNYDYELNQVFFEDLEIRKPDHFLSSAGDTPAQTIARVIELSDKVMEIESPDAVLLYGDTNSCLAVIAAKRRKIPVFHMEAGNRCFDQRVPEELNRKILDHLSDINLVLTEHARRYLIAEGIRPETVIKTGSHMYEVLDYYSEKIKASRVLSKLELDSKNYILVSAHREENVDSPENLKKLLQTLRSLASKYQIPIIVSTHPRTQKRLAQLNMDDASNFVRFMKPFGFTDYVKLQQESKCVVSDSGTITEEAALLGLPAVMIRNVHERPEGMDSGILIMAGLDADSVIDAVEIVSEENIAASQTRSSVIDYELPSVSKKIVKTVLSYTNYVNRTTWHKGNS